MTKENWAKKVDARGRRLLMDKGLSGPVEVLIRTEVPITAEQERQLRDAGCTVRSISGVVFSGVVEDTARLGDVAQLPYVRKIELSRPMQGEG